MKKCLIYGLRCPITDEYRYIGKSSTGIQRAKAHLTYSHNDSVNYWVYDLREKGLSPLIDIIEECYEEDLIIKEKFWIQFYMDIGCNLFNIIVYKGAVIEKLEKDIANAKEKLEEILNSTISEIDEISNIGGFIKKIRKKRGLKQSDLSEIACITEKTIYMLENNKGNPSYATVEKLLDILGYKLVPKLKLPST